MNEKPEVPEMIEVCSIRISFPVESDDQAIEYKKKIGEVLAPIPTARIEFTLTTVPIPMKPNASSITNPDK